MVDCGAVYATPQTFQPLVHVLAELCSMTTSHLSFTEHQKMLSSPSMPSVSPSMPSVLRCSVRVSTSAHVACRNARAQREARESKRREAIPCQLAAWMYVPIHELLAPLSSCTSVAQVQGEVAGSCPVCLCGDLSPTLCATEVLCRHGEIAAAAKPPSLLLHPSRREKMSREALCWPRRFVQRVARSSRIHFSGSTEARRVIP